MPNAASRSLAVIHRRRAGRATRRLSLAACVVAGTLTLAACAGDARAPADSGVAALPADAHAVTSAPPDSGCVMTAPWRECALLKRLESAGLAPARLAEPVRQPPLDAPGTAYRVGSAEVHAFFLADSVEAARAAAGIDPASVAPPADDVTYTLPPLVISNGNLVAVLFGRTERQLERLELALAAGLPAQNDR